MTSTRQGAIELRCRAAFVTLQSEIRPEYSKEISPGPARSTPPRWPRWKTRKAGSCGCESYGVPHAGALPPSAEPPRSRHPASVTMFARAVERRRVPSACPAQSASIRVTVQTTLSSFTNGRKLHNFDRFDSGAVAAEPSARGPGGGRIGESRHFIGRSDLQERDFVARLPGT